MPSLWWENGQTTYKFGNRQESNTKFFMLSDRMAIAVTVLTNWGHVRAVMRGLHSHKNITAENWHLIPRPGTPANKMNLNELSGYGCIFSVWSSLGLAICGANFWVWSLDRKPFTIHRGNIVSLHTYWAVIVLMGSKWTLEFILVNRLPCRRVKQTAHKKVLHYEWVHSSSDARVRNGQKKENHSDSWSE